MPIYKRQDIPKLFKQIEQGVTSQIYLLFGERYLCRNTAQELIDRLLPDEKQQATGLHHIDGDEEDINRTLNLLKTYSLFSGRKIFWVTDTKLFYSKGIARSLWEKACEKNDRNEPEAATRYLLQMLNLAAVSPREITAENITSLSAARWKTLFGFNKPQTDLTWVQDLLKKLPAEKEPAKTTETDAAARYTQALEAGIPQNNILILLAEAVDKRKKLFKYIQEHGIVVDLAVDTGTSSAARRDQEKILTQLLYETLEKYHKKIEPETIPTILERIGFHPVAVVMETEKLALYVGERQLITRDDVDVIIGRTREEALFELTEAVSAGNLEEGLLIVDHLLSGGIHALMILATLRNHLKKMLLIRSLQESGSPPYLQSQSFPVFQKNYLPKIREGRDEWTSLLWKNHPYSLYMLFRQAAGFSCKNLQAGLKEILAAEYRMKGSALETRLIMDDLLFTLLRLKAPEVHAA